MKSNTIWKGIWSGCDMCLISILPDTIERGLLRSTSLLLSQERRIHPGSDGLAWPIKALNQPLLLYRAGPGNPRWKSLSHLWSCSHLLEDISIIWTSMPLFVSCPIDAYHRRFGASILGRLGLRSIITSSYGTMQLLKSVSRTVFVGWIVVPSSSARTFVV